VSHPETIGNGQPDCPKCRGRGAVDGPLVHGKVPSAVRCSCVLVRQTLYNMDRGLPGLTKSAPLASSPLRGYEKKNLWVTTSDVAFRRHLRHVAARQGPDWGFKVASDKDLITAWLSTIAFKGGEILDPDAAAEAASVSLKYLTIEDLAEPPELLVVLLGVKAAANKEMPQVLFEALRLRNMRDKPTWVIDQPTNPFRMGHICWSGQVQATLEDYPHLWLDESTQTVASERINPELVYVPAVMVQGMQLEPHVVPFTPFPMTHESRDLLDEAMSRKPKRKPFTSKSQGNRK
jgi:hypothetical protein